MADKCCHSRGKVRSCCWKGAVSVPPPQAAAIPSRSSEDPAGIPAGSGISPAPIAALRSPCCATRRVHNPRLLHPCPCLLQQRFPGAQRGLGASPSPTEMQHSSEYPGLARKSGFYIPCVLHLWLFPPTLANWW